jgi:hypothetical protein
METAATTSGYSFLFRTERLVSEFQSLASAFISAAAFWKYFSSSCSACARSHISIACSITSLRVTSNFAACLSTKSTSLSLTLAVNLFLSFVAPKEHLPKCCMILVTPVYHTMCHTLAHTNVCRPYRLPRCRGCSGAATL